VAHFTRFARPSFIQKIAQSRFARAQEEDANIEQAIATGVKNEAKKQVLNEVVGKDKDPTHTSWAA